MKSVHDDYDAWNRLVKLTKGYRDSGGTLQSGSEVALMYYDGLGRRIIKQVKNSADLDCTYHYYLDGQSIVEQRNGSDQVIKQEVWGFTYVDELIQVAINSDPSADSTCEQAYWTLQDANYNVSGVVDSTGTLVERYEYTPYGQRTVFFSPGANDSGSYAPTLMSRRRTISSVAQPWGLCEFGHQGLMHDEESGLVYNRARMLHPVLGRFVQRDPLGYVDGMNVYAAYFVPDEHDPFGCEVGDWIPNWHWLGPAADFAAGVGDSLSMGITSWIRQQLDVDEFTHYDSGYYKAGEATECAVEVTVTLGGGALRKVATKASGYAARQALEGGARNAFRRVMGIGRGGFIHHWNPIRQGRYPLPFRWAARGYWNMVHLTQQTHRRAHRMLQVLDDLDVIRAWTSPIRSAGNAIVQHINEAGTRAQRAGECLPPVDVEIEMELHVTYSVDGTSDEPEDFYWGPLPPPLR